MPDPITNAKLTVTVSAEGFPQPSIQQWRRDGHSVPGQSSTDYSFDVSSGGSVSATIAFPNYEGGADSAWDGTPIAIVVIGDSTSRDHGGGDPTDGMPAELLAFSGRKLTIVANCAADGTTTKDWSDNSAGSLLSMALLKAKAGNATHIMITLGPNDCSVNHQITAADYLANMDLICASILANGQKPILNYGLLPLVSAGENSWTQASIDLGLSYRAGINSLVDGKHVLLGDVKLPDYLRANPATYIGGTLQESPLVGGYHQWTTGRQHTSRMWAEGLELAVNPSARSLRSTWNNPPMVNPDGSINWANRANHWNLFDRDSVSKRIGGHFKSFHPGIPPDTREALYQYPDQFEPLIRDKMGFGNTVTIDGDLGHPGKNFVTEPTPQEVYPFNLSAPGGKPGVDPGVNNLKTSLPPNAINVLDPANNPAGYHTTTGDITRSAYLANTSGFTVISGKGDGFTPPETFMKAERQQWIDQGNGLFSKLRDGNYWSVRGQTLFVPPDPTTVSPIAPVQFGAYYGLVIRTSPKAGGTPYGAITTLRNISAIYVSDKIVCGEALAIGKTADGKWLLTCIPAPTSRDPDAPPPPSYEFPAGEIPTHVSSSDMNELALVTVWTPTGSKAVIFELQGYALKGHSQPWYAFSNLGSFSGFRRIGEQALTFACPTVGKIGTNAALAPQPDPGSINLADPNQRAGYSNFADPGHYMCFPNKAWFAVASKEEGDFVFYDFTPWMNAVWLAYMEPDQNKWETTRAAHDDGTFPPLFSADPSFAPTVSTSLKLDRPTCMIASGYGGPEIGFGWSDFQKLGIGCEDGTIHFITISWYVDTYNWTGYNPPDVTWNKPKSIWGSIWVGRGLVNMFWAKFSIPNSEIHYLDVMNQVTVDHRDQDANGYANALYCVTRGDNCVKLVIFHWDQANQRQVYGTHLVLKSDQVKDACCGAMQDRFNLVNVGDFDGEAVHTYQKDYAGRGSEPDDRGNTNAYPGFWCPPDPRDATKQLGYAGKYKPGGPVAFVVNNNGN